MAPAPDYRAGFLAPAEAESLYRALRDRVPWRRETLQLYGRRVAVPRLLAWCGDAGVNYRYAGADHPCHGWWPSLVPLRDRLQEELGIASNLVLLNRYRDGADYMGWHADDEPGLAARVVSVSLGARRRFLLRPRAAKRSLGIDLDSGSALIMDGRLRHSLPRTRRPVGERINLTFRLLARRSP